MKNWAPLDWIVLVLALTVAAILVLASIKPLFGENLEVSENSAKLLAGILGSLVSVISVYIGAKVQKKINEN